jgi:asparagine synthase (glutamine-hydrolysing)
MCGICGIIHLDLEKPLDPADLVNMTRTLRHRGPDDEGFYVEGPVGLGHRRLAIIDLATGRQPLVNEDGTIWIVCNGEIYNYQELRRSLRATGHQFASASDTEVVLHAYEQDGPGCVKQLNGMFALAIWDVGRRRLLLSRDRAGIKPLYYASAPGLFLFASELKALLRHPAIRRQLDLPALHQYLSLDYVPTPRTIFKGIHKLAPGHTLILEPPRECLAIRPYWDMCLKNGENGTKPVAEYVAEFQELFPEVIRQELTADVPVGVLLSGGLDSSAIAAQAVKAASGKVQSFTVAFEDASFDESAYARRVASYLGTEHHEITLTPQKMLELVPRLAEVLDEPLGDSSFIPTFLLSQYTRQQVKVALGGDGGDELFAGYSTLQAHQLTRYYQFLVPGRLRHYLAGRLLEGLPVSFNNISLDFKLRRFLAGQTLSPLLRHHYWLGSFTAAQRQQLLRPEWLSRENVVDRLILDHSRQSGAREILNQVLYCDMKLYLEGDILPKVDRASMANSLEVRVPFLNYRMLEFAARLPRRFKLRGLTRKYLLRLSLKGQLPADIIRRSKKGFNMPVAEWLTGPLYPLAADLFSETRLNRGGIFNAKYVQALLNEHLSRRQDHRKLLWTLLVFELWREKWLRN